MIRCPLRAADLFVLLDVQKGRLIDQNRNIWYIRIHRIHFCLAVQTVQERTILMDYSNVIDRMITILGIDREALDRRLSVVGRERRRIGRIHALWLPAGSGARRMKEQT